MLSTKVFSSASNAQKYYSHADYYGAEALGVWFGDGVKDFGVAGSFDAKTDKNFKDLLNGKMPDGRSLGKIDKKGDVIHRPGMDLTFSSPKSVSIQMHVLGTKKEKEDLQAARTRALHSTLKYVQDSGMVYTRLGKGGKIREPVKNLCFATFTHTTNRKLEPQDHVHCLLLNAAKSSGGKYRTIVWDKVLNNNKYIGQIFRNELALEVKKLGYEIRTTKLSDRSSSFEIKEVSQNLIDAFSTRRKEIVELFKRYNVHTKEGKERIVINSREAKKTLPEGQLKEAWSKVVKDVAAAEKTRPKKSFKDTTVEKKKDQTVAGNITQTKEIKPKESFKDRVIEKIRTVLDKTVYRNSVSEMEAPKHLSAIDVTNLALETVSFNHSVFTEENTLHTFLKYGIGKYGINDARRGFQELLETKDIIVSAKGDGLFATKELLTLEKAILRFGKRGIGKCSAMIKEDQFAKRFKLYESQRKQTFKLNKQQREAVKHIVTSKDKIVAIQGRPGVGKSTVVESIKDMVGSKFNLFGTAPTASAAKSLKQTAGLASQTLHSFIGEAKGKGATMQAALKGSVVIVDEASFVGTKLMHELLKLSETFKFRVVLIGDTKQLGAVEAGDPFGQLLNVIKYVNLKTILRQKDDTHKQAVTDAASNNVLNSFKIHEQNIKEAGNFVEQSVKKYLSMNKAERDNTLLISPSRKYRDEINVTIVERLIKQGALSSKRHRLDILRKPQAPNSADFNCAKVYSKGDIVTFYKSYKSLGVVRGESLELFKANSVSNTLLFKRGFRNIRYQLRPGTDYTGKLEVFQRDKLRICEGMKLRFTKNANGFINSETAEIKSIDGKNKMVKLQLEDKSIRTTSFSDLKYVDIGYCSTVHSAQGKTIDKLIAALSIHKKLNSLKLWLVTISRHKSKLCVYMQNKGRVQTEISMNAGTEKTALDIVSPSEKNKHLTM